MSDLLSNGDGERLPNGLHELAEGEGNPKPLLPNPVNAAESRERNEPGSPATPASKPRICGAKTRNGTPCKRLCTPGRPRCRLHGGLTPFGFAHYRTKTGARSKYIRAMAPDMARSTARALKDDKLLALDEEVATLQGRIVELFERLAQTECPRWGAVVDALVSYEQARKTKDLARRQRLFVALAKTIRQGSAAAEDQEAIWGDIKETMALKAKLSLQEHNRMIDLNYLVNADDALGLFKAVLFTTSDVLKERIQDSQQVRKLVNEISIRLHALLPSPHNTKVIDAEVINNEEAGDGPQD